ncbi:MAG: hypothetical protein WCJ92_02250 [Alphaproteobacteria bacterium]
MNKFTIILCLCLISLSGAAVESAALETVPTIKSLGLRISSVESIEVKLLRARAANTLLGIYHHLNRAGRFREPMPGGGYEPPVIPGEHWEVVKSGTSSVLIPIIDCSIVDALNDIRTAPEGTIRTECYTASVIARIALGDCFLAPDRKNYRNSRQCFRNYAFPAGKLDAARLDVLRELFFKRPEASDGRAIETGDFVYLFGHPNYKNIGFGPYDGENVYMVGYGADNLRMYVGFGDFFKSGPKTEKQIQWNLAVMYVEELLKIVPCIDEVFAIEVAFEEIRAIKSVHRRFDIEEVMIAQSKRASK